MKLKKEERNFITVLIAIIAVLLLFLLFINFNLRTKHKQSKSNFLDKYNPDRIRINRIRELITQGNQIQKDRYLIKEALLRQRAIVNWAEKRTNQFLNMLRYLIFISVTAAFILTWSFPKAIIGFNTDDVLRIISVSIILFVLAFFASSEENDSLKMCYQRVKPATIRFFMYLTRLYYKYINKYDLHFKETKILLSEMQIKYEALVPIMNELRKLDRQ